MSGSNEPPQSAHALGACFRFHYAIRLGLTLAAGAAVSTLTVYAVLSADLGDYAEGVTTISSVRSMVLAAAALSGLIQLVLTGILVAALALFASHKIAGPMVRLARLLRAVADGRLPDRVQFRSGDQTGRLAAHFNRIGERLAERHAGVVEPLGALRSSLDELERFLGQSGGGEQGRLLAREICESADALAGNLGRLAASLEADPAGSRQTTLRARGRPDGAEPER